MEPLTFEQLRELIGLIFIQLTGLIVQVILAWKTGQDRRAMEKMREEGNE